MKIKFLSIALLSAVLSLASCDTKKEAAEADSVEGQPAVEAVDTETAPASETDTTAVAAASEHKDGETIEVTGLVKEINKGKDGYTAKLYSESGKLYSATISIPNMKDPKQYRSVNVGDKISVKGEVTNLETEAIIVVRELK
jgi:RecJ-like exonuclease